jgi:4-hydroxy-4-methyl-2-oxoglutarate aldolase
MPERRARRRPCDAGSGQVPVVLDGVGVMPGQYVFADSSGAVVIPDGQIEEVLAEARNIEAADAASRDQIARERVRER